MLGLIHVRNYAIVDDVELELGAGLNVMTGETGAGKSILVDALGLALGDRADATAVRHGTDRAEITAAFECEATHPVLAHLRELELDDGPACILRRVVGQEGRSRAFINGRPVTLQDLRQVGALLVDIHGQHAHQSLLEAANQRLLVDTYGGLEEAVARVAQCHGAWSAARARLTAREADHGNRAARVDLLTFQLQELETLGLTAGEPAELDSERRRLAHADRLAAGVDAALNALYDAETESAQALVTLAVRELGPLVAHDEALAEPVQQLAAVEIELREAAHTLAHYREHLESDPGRLEWIESRLATARHLASRHGVDVDALPDLATTLGDELAGLAGGKESLEALQRDAEQTQGQYRKAAEALSSARQAAAKTLGDAVTAELAGLGMPDGALEISVEQRAGNQGDSTGIDQIELMARFNVGQPLRPLARVASGGELSRLSLALETVAVAGSAVGTLVFDEVDAGIGGGVAEIVGRKLARIATTRQVLCVTHLPQVASQGTSHYHVIKRSEQGTTRTEIRQLDADARIEELSRMLGGLEITTRARDHAKEMIERAAGHKP